MNSSNGDRLSVAEQQSEFLLYNAENGDINVQVRLYEGSVWLSQRSIADLYQKSISTIAEHISNIFEEGELPAERVSRVFEIKQEEGKHTVTRNVICYNLEMIIAVGYRVKSSRGTQFRQWATRLIQEYVIKGFVLDDKRLANPPEYGEDYFDDLLARIRVIRASEKRLYKKVLDIYKLSVDYNPQMPEAKKFFATVQNKIHYAVHGHTASELLVLRAHADKVNMGLTAWQNSPDGRINFKAAMIAKNYLDEEELREMNSLVNQFLEYAEQQAHRRIPMTMTDWEEKLNGILKFNDKTVLLCAGTVSHKAAMEYIQHEYEEYTMRMLEAEKTEDDRDLENLISDAKLLSKSKSEK